MKRNARAGLLGDDAGQGGGAAGGLGSYGARARRALGSRKARPALVGVAVVASLLLLYAAYVSQYDPVTCSTAAIVCMDRVFRENGLSYWLDYGSLLGAVRHKGFIPWDAGGDVDIGFFKRDEHAIRGLRQAFQNECGMDMIHRNDTAWLPGISAFVIKRGAFRLFCAPWVPYYVDLADYTVEPDGQGGEVVVDHHYWPSHSVRHPSGEVVPINNCQFGSDTLMCPAQPESILARIYGPSWRVPDPNYYDSHAH